MVRQHALFMKYRKQEIAREFMSDCVWNERLSVGNELIDSDHRNLINQVNDLIRAIEARNSSDIAQAFRHLESELCRHFANEEKIAREIDFDISCHKLAQQYWLDELLFLKDLLSSRKCLWFDDAIGHFTRFLKSWMIDSHIYDMDMRMKRALQAFPYNLRNDEAHMVEAQSTCKLLTELEGAGHAREHVIQQDKPPAMPAI